MNLCCAKLYRKRTHGRWFAFLIVTARESEEEEVYRELTQLRNLARCLRDYCETNSHRTVETIVRTRDINPLRSDTFSSAPFACFINALGVGSAKFTKDWQTYFYVSIVNLAAELRFASDGIVKP